MYHSGNQLIDPQLLFQKAQLRPGMRLADLGCGRTGHLVFPASMIAGERGLVYAVDILKDVLENIKKRADLENRLNIHAVWANLEKMGGTAIPAQSLDTAFLINILHQSDNYLAILAEAKRLLKEKGRLVIADWFKKGLPFAPPAERYIDFQKIKDWARQNGFTVQEEFVMGKYHQGLVLYKLT